MSKSIDDLIFLLYNQKNPKERQQTLNKLHLQWKQSGFSDKIIETLLAVLKDSKEDIETRLLAATKLDDIKKDYDFRKSKIYNSFLDELISAYKIIIELEFGTDIKFINYIVSKIKDIGEGAISCFKSIQALYAKKIDYQILETANDTLYRIDEKKTVDFFLSQLHTDLNVRVIRSMLNILNNHLKTNKIWPKIKDKIIPLMSHKDKSIRNRAIPLVKGYGHVTDGENNLLNQMEKEKDYTIQLQIIIALGTVGTTNKETISLLSHHLHSGDANFTKYAKESLDKIADRSTGFDDYKEMINFIVKGEKRKLIVESGDFRKEEFCNPNLFSNQLVKNLINDLNLEYSLRHNTCVFMLVRKLIENLVIDIIRKRYPNREDLLTYEDRKKRRMIHNLSTLIDNLFTDTNIFVNLNLRQYDSTIKQIEEKLEEICEIINPVLHSIALHPNDKDIEDLRLLSDTVFPILAKLHAD